MTGLSVENTSGTLPGFDPINAVDDNEGTYWSSPGVKPARIEHITVDIGSEVEVGRVRLLSSNQSPLLFAKSFQIQVGNDPQANFATGVTVTNFVATSATWYTFDLPSPLSGRYVQIRITEMNRYSNKKYYTQLAEIEVFSPVPVTNGLALLWTAPGADLQVGTASKYFVRYATTEILDDDDFDNATPVPDQDVPGPQAAGSPESLTLTGLPPEQLLWFAVKTEDESSNVSQLSNVIQASTPGSPPGPITGLQVLNGLATGSSITLEFVEPPNDAGDNGSGPVDHYEVGCSTSAINGVGDFEALAPFGPGPSPVNPGNTLAFEVTGLANQTTYSCAVRAVDPGGLMSALSAVVLANTLDKVAPAQVSNLSVGFASTPVSLTVENSSGAISPEVNVLDADPSTSWISPGVRQHRQEWITLDLGAEASLGQVRLLSNNQSVALFPRSFKLQVGNDPNNNFTDALTVAGFVATPSTWYSFNFPPVSGRYVRVLVTEMNLYSNGKFYASLAGVEASEAGGPDIDATLTWGAPADDGATGTAATSYEIRYDTGVITSTNFDGATLAATGLTPKSPGSSESFTIEGLLPETLYYFAIKTSDEVDNPSFSIISATTP